MFFYFSYQEKSCSLPFSLCNPYSFNSSYSITSLVTWCWLSFLLLLDFRDCTTGSCFESILVFHLSLPFLCHVCNLFCALWSLLSWGAYLSWQLVDRWMEGILFSEVLGISSRREPRRVGCPYTFDSEFYFFLLPVN